MNLRNFFRSRKPRRGRGQAGRAWRRPTLERLECREVLATNVTLLPGALDIQANPAGCWIRIYDYLDMPMTASVPSARSAGQATTALTRSGTQDVARFAGSLPGKAEPAVRVTLLPPGPQMMLVVQIYGLSEPARTLTYPEALVGKIVFQGSAFKDRVECQTASPGVVFVAQGNGGADELFGGPGADTLDGGAGDDTLWGGPGADELRGGLGQDKLRGQEQEDRLYGGDQNDFLFGGPGHDRLEGGPGEDHLAGEEDNDTVLGEAGQDTLVGYLGADLLDGGDQADALYGGDHDDTVRGGLGNDTLDGGAGNDELVGDYGHDRLDGQAGNDTLRGGSDHDTLNGGDGQDYLDAYHGNDVLEGGGGNDTLYGGADNDQLSGGAGNDLLDGEDGADWLRGGDQDDTLAGGWGNDTLQGEAGHDTLYGGGHDDLCQGGAGYDLLQDWLGNDTLSGDAGNDVLRGFAGDDQLFGGDGKDWLYGDADRDTLWGGAETDVLNGGDGDDQLFGGDGVDWLYGDAGNDGLHGGVLYHQDQFFGGAGNDRFLRTYYGPKAGCGVMNDLGANDVEIRLLWNTWDERQVEVIAQGLALLQSRANGGTWILKDPKCSEPLLFERFNSMAYDGLNALKWDFGWSRTIFISNWNPATPGANGSRLATVIHEVGHNWNEKDIGNAQWAAFDKLHGASSVDQDYVGIYDQGQPYGKANAMEDWATCWEMFFGFATQANSSNLLKQKLALVAAFFASR